MTKTGRAKRHLLQTPQETGPSPAPPHPPSCLAVSLSGNGWPSPLPGPSNVTAASACSTAPSALPLAGSWAHSRWPMGHCFPLEALPALLPVQGQGCSSSDNSKGSVLPHTPRPPSPPPCRSVCVTSASTARACPSRGRTRTCMVQQPHMRPQQPPQRQ